MIDCGCIPRDTALIVGGCRVLCLGVVLLSISLHQAGARHSVLGRARHGLYPPAASSSPTTQKNTENCDGFSREPVTPHSGECWTKCFVRNTVVSTSTAWVVAQLASGLCMREAVGSHHLGSWSHLTTHVLRHPAAPIGLVFCHTVVPDIKRKCLLKAVVNRCPASTGRSR